MKDTLKNVWLTLCVLGGIWMLIIPAGADDWDAGWASVLAGILMFIGLAVRQLFSRTLGDVLIAIASLGLLLMYWLVVPVIVGIFLAVVAIMDAIRSAQAATASQT